MNAVDSRVCLSLIQSELSGYQGYPHNPAGEARFARALGDVAVSVEHAVAILAKFTIAFPTVQEITDTGINLRPQFEPKCSQRAEWEREYGQAAPVAVDPLPRTAAQHHSLMWHRLKEHLSKKHEGVFPGWAKISWGETYRAMAELGYPLNSWQHSMLGR